VNCRFQWIIESLNASCALGIDLRACLLEYRDSLRPVSLSLSLSLWWWWIVASVVGASDWLSDASSTMTKWEGSLASVQKRPLFHFSWVGECRRSCLLGFPVWTVKGETIFSHRKALRLPSCCPAPVSLFCLSCSLVDLTVTATVELSVSVPTVGVYLSWSSLCVCWVWSKSIYTWWMGERCVSGMVWVWWEDIGLKVWQSHWCALVHLFGGGCHACMFWCCWFWVRAFRSLFLSWVGLFFVTVDVDMTGVVCVCVWMMSSSHCCCFCCVWRCQCSKWQSLLRGHGRVRVSCWSWISDAWVGGINPFCPKAILCVCVSSTNWTCVCVKELLWFRYASCRLL